MASVTHLSRVRSLYKRILVLHRFMPLELKALGDQYVKDEFRRNKGASPEEVKVFMVEWEKYRDTMQTQVLDAVAASGSGPDSGPGKRKQFGSELSEDQLKSFQDEQVGQLYELMLEATKPSRQFDIQDDRT
ncbi:succinate dehydrogenase assembly factor 3, mitochondrial-like [Engraulis encrasicolus]|uniref:succinate dehydrogenase assembly factor 3, mitochondrial n=1 Tax=Engraulis encrasicolus TaxID=184585 RepID=UPI002FD6C164